MALMAYRRENGRVGIRNNVILLPVDDLSNTACEAVANIVPGVLALPHAYGRLQFGADLELLFRTLIGTGQNPNVAAAIVIGIEPVWAKQIADGIGETGKPVAYFGIEQNGDLRTIERASRVAQRMLQDASELQRTPCELHEIMVSIKCGESDTTTGLASCPTVAQVVDRVVDAGGTVLFGETSELTGGEHLIADRCATPEVREKFLTLYKSYIDVLERSGADMLGSQPTKGNIAGGLSTIEEKALGNIEKTGTKPVVDALEPAVKPTKQGLNFMDSSSAGAEFITLMCAAGAVLHFFPTGQGNIVGHPVEPVVKVTGNPHTAETMSEHIDLDCSDLLTRKINIRQAGDMLMSILERTVNGRLTAAETMGHREFVMTRLYQSA